MRIEYHRKKVYEDLFDEHLFRHCAIELSDAFTSILESHGYSDKVSGIIDALYTVINHDIGAMKFGEHKRFVYNDTSLFDNIDVFFTGFSLTLDVDYADDYKGYESRGKYNDRSKMLYKNGKVDFVPNIVVYAKGNDNLGIRRVIGKTLGHEFTHAYNDYEMFLDSGGTIRLKDAFMQGYWSAAQQSPNKIERFVDEIIYFTDRSERNAHIAQMKQELDNYDEPMFTAHTFTAAIQTTETYKKLRDVISALSMINDIVKKDPERKEDVVKVVNSLTKRNFVKYKDAFLFLRDRVVRAKLKFDEQAPKIAYDVYREKMDKFGRF